MNGPPDAAAGASRAGAGRARSAVAARAVDAIIGRPLLADRDGALHVGPPAVLRVVAGRIAAIEPANARESAGGTIGDRDAVLAPALADAHVHLVATAAGRAGIDLAVDPPRRLEELLSRLAASAAAPRVGAAAEATRGRDAPPVWVRVSGFDEAWLDEGRAPRLDELDRAVPDRPLRLRHATRHASWLNSAGLAALERALGPLGDRAARDARGRPVGVVYGLEREITSVVGPLPEEALHAGLRGASRDLARAGVAAVDDVTGSNDAARIALLARAVERGDVVQRVRALVCDADEVAAAARAAGAHVAIAGVKLFAHAAEDAAAAAFREALSRARRAGLPVAVHAVEADVVQAALEALAAAPPRAAHASATSRALAAVPDRIEHAALCPPELARRIARAGVAVVAQPGFLVARGEKYVREVEEALWPWLVPLRTLRAHGVLVAAGSDSPVGPLDPRAGLSGATSRRSARGDALGAAERIAPADALALYTSAPAALRGEVGGAAPWPSVGQPADVALLAQPPPPGATCTWDWWRARAVIGGGEAVWKAEDADGEPRASAAGSAR